MVLKCNECYEYHISAISETITHILDQIIYLPYFYGLENTRIIVGMTINISSTIHLA